MNIVDIIEKKKHGKRITREEINFLVEGYVNDKVPDYQIAALLMAVWFSGMDEQETTDLTLSMVASGDTVDLSSIPGIKVDKHSTGGVADTTTLILGPLVAACGGKMAKMSGRGLGHTGGTLDKLESIPGFSVNRTMEQFIHDVSTIGLSVIGQTQNLVPADKKLYALRDVTGTVDNLSLIAASIMSKKIAAGSDAILLDVKTGSGAFMKDEKEAVELAKRMVEIGNLAGRTTEAIVTNMDQPLGNAVGNALEVWEALEILGGEYEGDLLAVSYALARRMLILGGQASSEDEAQGLLEEALLSGRALKKMEEMIEVQGGNPKVLRDRTLLPQAEEIVELPSDREGYLRGMDASEIGRAAQMLGAGRTKKEDPLDYAVGIWMKKRLGDRVIMGEPIAELYLNSKEHKDAAEETVLKALEIGIEKPKQRPLLYRVLD